MGIGKHTAKCKVVSVDSKCKVRNRSFVSVSKLIFIAELSKVFKVNDFEIWPWGITFTIVSNLTAIDRIKNTLKRCMA